MCKFSTRLPSILSVLIRRHLARGMMVTRRRSSPLTKMGVRAGGIFSCIGLACLIGTPIGGALISHREDRGLEQPFLGAQIFAGACLLVGGSFFAGEPGPESWGGRRRGLESSLKPQDNFGLSPFGSKESFLSFGLCLVCFCGCLGTLAVTKLRSGAGNDEWRGDELLATVDTTYPMALELTHTSSVLLLRIGKHYTSQKKSRKADSFDDQVDGVVLGTKIMGAVRWY